jgi:hypothetical protein
LRAADTGGAANGTPPKACPCGACPAGGVPKADGPVGTPDCPNAPGG